MTLGRTTYVVVDEADLLAGSGPRLQTLRALPRSTNAFGLHPERQLFLICATWSDTWSSVATELCERARDVVKISIHPDVPKTPQGVRLRQEPSERLEDFRTWFRDE